MGIRGARRVGAAALSLGQCAGVRASELRTRAGARARTGWHRPPNGYGLFDMCENVHEWCADWYDPGYYAVSPVDNPPGPVSGNAPRIARRRVAASYQDCALRGAQQHPAGVLLCGLWLPRGCVFIFLTSSPATAILNQMVKRSESSLLGGRFAGDRGTHRPRRIDRGAIHPYWLRSGGNPGGHPDRLARLLRGTCPNARRSAPMRAAVLAAGRLTNTISTPGTPAASA